MSTSGFTTALYLFDVANGIDLDAVRRRLGDRASTALIGDKAAGPVRVRYVQPPVIVDGADLGRPTLDGFHVRVKFYEYGVISLMLRRPFAGSWAELIDQAQTLIENETLEARALEACQRIVATCADAVKEARTSFLSEDYLVFTMTPVDPPVTAETLLAAHATDIAQIVRGERQLLSAQERDEVLRHRWSYLADDLVVFAWNAAFVYDAEPAALAAIEIVEYANSQLLELRYHDELLEAETTRLYARLEERHWLDPLRGRRHTQAARRVQALYLDVNELTDRMENAVKFVGDPYAARLFGLAAARLGLDRWKKNVEDKLDTLDDIHRFAVEQTAASRGDLLELAIIAILLLELGLFFAGIMT
ncbi:MAG TPA: hypothetical protein VFO19_19045 [Vicinamibacterales bacterium]|nr:hypothetical protein [Vicinamibacterales bacterium]